MDGLREVTHSILSLHKGFLSSSSPLADIPFRSSHSSELRAHGLHRFCGGHHGRREQRGRFGLLLRCILQVSKRVPKDHLH